MTHLFRNIALMTLAFVMSAADCYSMDEINANGRQDSVAVRKQTFFRWLGRGITNFIHEFKNVDTNYVEPQHYKFQVMLQNTNTFDRYILKADDNELRLAPRVQSRLGPYVGYSLIFLGYTLQLNHLYLGTNLKTFDLSLYTAIGGIDVFYRNNADMRIRYLKINDERLDGSALTDVDFNGAEISSAGFDIYYIFNHKRHSYPAAYNQSTCQKRSAGSALVGFGFSHHKLDMDWLMFDKLASENVPGYINPFSTEELISKIEYYRYNLYGGYSYNLVPFRNFLIGASAAIAVGLNHASGDVVRFSMQWGNFSNHNFFIDGTGRIGIVWNNTRLFAGAAAQIHSYTYTKDRYALNNLFGNVIIYTGFNFGKKKKYRKPGKFFEF